VKPIRPVATVRVRRELAQLLKRLRTIRRTKLSSDEIAEQMSAALREAGTISRMVSVYPYLDQHTRQDVPPPSERSSPAAPGTNAAAGSV
jgi:hypothetical protein